MPDKVIDASALAALLFNEPDAERIVRQVADARLLAPSLIGFEVASVCLKKMRLHPPQSDLLFDTFALIQRLDLNILPVNHLQTITLARDSGLTAYDASYLWLARECQCELVTLDKRLAAAAKR